MWTAHSPWHEFGYKVLFAAALLWLLASSMHGKAPDKEKVEQLQTGKAKVTLACQNNGYIVLDMPENQPSDPESIWQKLYDDTRTLSCDGWGKEKGQYPALYSEIKQMVSSMPRSGKFHGPKVLWFDGSRLNLDDLFRMSRVSQNPAVVLELIAYYGLHTRDDKIRAAAAKKYWKIFKTYYVDLPPNPLLTTTSFHSRAHCGGVPIQCM